MTAFFTALLDISLVSCWLIAAVVLLRLVFRKRAPKWVLCVLWGVVALRLVLPFSIQSPFGLVPERASAVSSAFAAAETEQIESPSHNAYRPAEQIARPARQEGRSARRSGAAAGNAAARLRGNGSRRPRADRSRCGARRSCRTGS